MQEEFGTRQSRLSLIGEKSSRSSLIGDKKSKISAGKKKGVFVLGGAKQGDDLILKKKVTTRGSITNNDLASSSYQTALDEDFNQVNYSGEMN